MTKRLDFGAVDRRTIIKAGAVAGLAQIASPFVGRRAPPTRSRSAWSIR